MDKSMRTLFFISLCCFMLLATEVTDHDTHGAAPDQDHGTILDQGHGKTPDQGHGTTSEVKTPHNDNSHGEAPIEGEHTI